MDPAEKSQFPSAVNHGSYIHCSMASFGGFVCYLHRNSNAYLCENRSDAPRGDRHGMDTIVG